MGIKDKRVDIGELYSIINEFTEDIQNVTDKEWLKDALISHFKNWFERNHGYISLEEAMVVVNNWWHIASCNKNLYGKEKVISNRR